MRDLARTLRVAGIAIGILFLIGLVWVVLLGPAAMILMAPRS